MSAVEKIENLPTPNGSAPVALVGGPTTPVTPHAMLSMAVASGNTELAEKIMGLVERWDARMQRKEFDAAIAAAKAEIPVITKNRTVSHGAGKAQFRHEDMAEIARTVDPILAKHGLGYRFRSEQTDRITVTCILFHSEGHSEENKLSGPPDVSGAKNALQAIGSTVTYLQRYTLKAALGLAAAADDDAKAVGGGAVITDEQVQDLNALLTETKSRTDTFLKIAGVESIPDIPAAQYQPLKRMLEQKKAAKP